MRKTTALPLFILADTQLFQIANALQEVDNELALERGPCEQSRQCVNDLLTELDRRAATYSIQGGKIIRG